ncbi:MAG: putative heme iron utilization protein [Cellvibrionaceae bacterium]|jgi:putative heme iron utilization protein
MSKTQQTALSNYQSSINALLGSVSTLSLGTVNEKKEPEVSLVPFLYHRKRFWVFVSQLSPHTQHLVDRSVCSVLIYNNQVEPKNHFAVERISATCAAQMEVDDKNLVLDLMEEKLGETVSLLRQLGDFHLFSLAPAEGRFIAGFGRAFNVNFSDLSLSHIDPSKID